MYQQIDAEKNDRGAAILTSTLVENWQNIRFAQQADKVFENNGPLSTFDAKILIADCLGMFGPDTRNNLNLIKEIRNTFAHARVPITFSSPEIQDACEALRPHADIQRLGGRTWSDARNKFIGAT
jgi:hypothetical protein